ncbi:hypothetical protein DPMN_143828 [Dreissena polymorpha]|uniref:C1q domain-containing protein n=1 Tax=Dreissena polymorpha TaxID=45954 RepID=A0A9D4GGY2_DREPO|nr:hypothetical protein DPMN_143828 [Dreissena polymorpha]
MGFIGHNGHFQVVHNGNMVCRMYVAGVSGTVTDTSAASIVLYLEKGDMVAIQNLDSGEYVFGDHYSFFSGFLLKETDNIPSVVG